MFSVDQYIVNTFNAKRFPKQKVVWKFLADARWLMMSLFFLPGLHLVIKNEWRTCIIMGISSVIAIIFGYALKMLILRPRPNNYITYLGKGDSSFPSLHALCAFNLAYLLTLFIPELTLLWWIIATLIGLSRMYIQVHYLTDVIGGGVLGIGLAHILLLMISYV